jgi:hypothetical protein
VCVRRRSSVRFDSVPVKVRNAGYADTIAPTQSTEQHEVEVKAEVEDSQPSQARIHSSHTHIFKQTRQPFAIRSSQEVQFLLDTSHRSQAISLKIAPTLADAG